MKNREFKEKVYDELARVTRALANPHRLEIIDLLAQGDCAVERISIETNLSVANASQHLQVLKAARLVDVSRCGNFIYYRLANSNVFKTWKALRELGAERITSIDKLVEDFRQSKFKTQSVTIDELLAKLKAGKVTILDVRPDAEYASGHIANAISIPFDKLSRRLKELRKHDEIVAYCRGPFCIFADEVVALLTKSGYKATRLADGFPDWAIRGLPVAVN